MESKVVTQSGYEYESKEENNNKPQISLFASAIRPNLFEEFLQSVSKSSVNCEVIFAGPLPPDATIGFTKKYKNFKYIQTGNIKPAQCYEIARRNCTGELIHWTADDCEYKGDILGKGYKYWKLQKNNQLILSLQTYENYGNSAWGKTLTDMNIHRFFGGNPNSPLMAPLGLMNRVYLEELGGYDKRYVCGQAENDIVMRVLIDGGNVEIFGGMEALIAIDHIAKHGKSHYGRPFAKGYSRDRWILEQTWTGGGTKVLNDRRNKFQPFTEDDIYIKSQSNNIIGFWE